MSFTYSAARNTARTHFTIKDITGKSFPHFLCSVSFEIPNLPIMLNAAVGLISQIWICERNQNSRSGKARHQSQEKLPWLSQDLLPVGTPRLMPEKLLLPTEWAFLYHFYSARRIRCSIQGYNFHKSRVITSCCPSRKAISYADLFFGKDGARYLAKYEWNVSWFITRGTFFIYGSAAWYRHGSLYTCHWTKSRGINLYTLGKEWQLCSSNFHIDK